MSWEQFRMNGSGLSNFSTWFDRHHGRGWCWRELDHSRAMQTGPKDVKEYCGYASRRAAKRGIEAELNSRKARHNAAAMISGG